VVRRFHQTLSGVHGTVEKRLSTPALEEFPRNVIMASFIETCRENSTLVTIRQKYQAPCMET